MPDSVVIVLIGLAVLGGAMWLQNRARKCAESACRSLANIKPGRPQAELADIHGGD